MKMRNVSRVSLSDLPVTYPTGIDLFICCASFETRCLSIASSLKAVKIAHKIVCFNDSSDELGAKFKANKTTLLKLFGGKPFEAPLRLNDPIFVADSIVKQLSSIPTGQVSTCVVDITTFTHEALLILLKILAIKFNRSTCDISFVYAAANDYSVDEPIMSKKWLTRGVGSVRSILGYASELNPTKATHLVILLGFEKERAKKLIDVFEPAKISLGLGRKLTSVNEGHFITSRVNFKSLAIREEEAETFNFSCTNPDQTKKDLNKHIAKYPEYNTIIATLNTKLSTLGAGLYSMDFPQYNFVMLLLTSIIPKVTQHLTTFAISIVENSER
jgi:hypothetical protein